MTNRGRGSEARQRSHRLTRANIHRRPYRPPANLTGPVPRVYTVQPATVNNEELIRSCHVYPSKLLGVSWSMIAMMLLDDEDPV